MKILNKILVLLCFFLTIGNAFSQEVSDFTIVDVEGESYNLYEQLDQGKPVILDMFARFCATCSESMLIVDTLWMKYGSGEDVQIWAIETSGYSDSIIQEYKLEHQVSFPFFTSLSNPFLLDSFPISYTPWYYVICPDRSLRQIDLEHLRAYVNACSSLSVGENENSDLKIYYYNSRFNFENQNNSELYKISIFSINGVFQYYEDNIHLNEGLEIKLSTGLYIVEVKSKNEFAVRRKVIVN